MAVGDIFVSGSSKPLPARRLLHAGPLSLIYEEGDLRYIKLGDREIIRRIYVAIRDRNWGTVPPVLSNIQMQIAEDSFEISYEVANKQNEIDFAWKGTIHGSAQGMIHFVMEGEARSSFWRNRIGFCILHPIRECAGARCTVEQADGSVIASRFPVYIAAQQPFLDMRSVTHEVLTNLWAEVRFEGDLFEMEDQRAWIDASYKTYCTPLSLGFPTEVVQGTRIRQSVTLTLRGELPIQPAIAANEPLRISLADAPAVPLPRIGLGSASSGQPLTDEEVARLRALNLSHLRVDLHLATTDVPARLAQAAEESRRIGIPLEVALFISDDVERELEALAALLPTIKPSVWAWLIFPEGLKSTTERLIRAARGHLTAHDATAKFGGGSNVYFAELNRDRPTPETLAQIDFLNYSANPQVHAFDNASLAETCEALASTVQSALQIADKPLSISPITLKPRFNAVATGPEADPPPGELPRQVDPRQLSLFGAAWTLGSLKRLAESGLVQHVTYYETVGWRGIMESETGSALPDKFPSFPGAVFPMYHLFADIGEFAGAAVQPIESSDALRVEGLLLQKNGVARLLLANWTNEVQQVRITFVTQGTIRVIDQTNVEKAMRSPEAFRATPAAYCESLIRLLPYALARIDMGTL